MFPHLTMEMQVRVVEACGHFAKRAACEVAPV
jgi:hypothetical protein